MHIFNINWSFCIKKYTGITIDMKEVFYFMIIGLICWLINQIAEICISSGKIKDIPQCQTFFLNIAVMLVVVSKLIWI